VDYGYAIDYLNRALQKKPNFAEPVFNLALVYERMNANDLAIGEWQQYLKLDPSGAWRDEAQRHLAALEQKKKSGRQP
jgi:tetratricopeptide (TPR) repeat protein